jgi:hypothetical protein
VLNVPQPDSSGIPIKQKDVDVASNVLDVFFHPPDEATAQFKHMIGEERNGPQRCMKVHFPPGKPGTAFIINPCHPSDMRLVPLMAYTMTVDVYLHLGKIVIYIRNDIHLQWHFEVLASLLCLRKSLQSQSIFAKTLGQDDEYEKYLRCIFELV